MKYVLIVFVILSYNLSVIAQNTFEFNLKNISADEVFNDAIQTENGSYILVCQNLYTDTTHGKANLIKISETGVFLDSIVFDFEGKESGLLYISKQNANNFLLIGYAQDGSENKLWLHETDSSFNTLSNKLFDVGPDLYSLNFIKDENDNYLIYGILYVTSWQSNLFVYKISPGFDSLDFKIVSEESSIYQPSLLRKADLSGYYLFCPSYGGWSGQTILETDNNFNILEEKSPPWAQTYPNSAWINNKILLSSNYTPVFDQTVVAYLMDTTFIADYELSIGVNDTTEYSGLRRAISFFEENNIFIGSTHNMHLLEYDLKRSWFCLTNIDSTLNIRWQKFYGGDANYVLWGLSATLDGGCLIYGTRYDSSNGPHERDVCAIKVNDEGLVDIPEINKTLAHDVILYPNPGRNEINIISGPQIYGANFELFSINGTIVFSGILKNNMKVNVDFLSPGNYIWKVKFQEKTIETGKWIKEL